MVCLGFKEEGFVASKGFTVLGQGFGLQGWGFRVGMGLRGSSLGFRVKKRGVEIGIKGDSGFRVKVELREGFGL